MIWKFTSMSLALKIAQGFFAFLTLSLQSRALSNNDFNILLVTGNATLMSVFLDLGVGVQFIQNHFKSTQVSAKNEDAKVLRLLRINLAMFVSISWFQSLLVSAYCMFYLFHLSMEFDPILLLVILVTTWIFSFNGLISRSLTARGYIVQTLRYQLFGVLVQVSFLYIIYLNQSHLTLFIASLAIPNLVVSLLAIRLLRKNSKKVVIDTNSIEIKKPKLNVFVQGLQFLLFTNVTVPLLIFSTSSSLILISQVLIYWRIVSFIGSAMSTMNSLEWRESAIYYSDFSQILNPERKYLIKKILMSLLISVAALMGIVILWDNLSSTPSTFGFITHLFWLFIVPSQVYQWHYYFKLLAAEEYLNLISAGAFQLVTTVLLMYVFDVDNSWRFPASYFFGLLTSGVYLNLRTHFMVRLTRIENA